MQAFVEIDDVDHPIPEEPREAPSAGAAKSLAKALAFEKAGVVAFSRTGDFELGEFEDAVILESHGRVPHLADFYGD
ncbi:hypothetical protein F0L46_08505 [Salinarimonas soli]|uniref:Uncharacterized protein n=1 Tax=Salinarimonas soli TaxID=1638099 RepID=A0A5B2VHI5_9HYPH|nr:hypothetical protein F0L46_08505 [Salinarimonas soli]